MDLAAGPLDIAIIKSSHIAGQKAGIMADLAIAPLPASSFSGQVVALAADHGLPKIPDYGIGMISKPGQNAPVCAAADYLRATFKNG